MIFAKHIRFETMITKVAGQNFKAIYLSRVQQPVAKLVHEGELL